MNGEINLKKFLQILRKRMLTILLTVLSVFILTSIVSIYFMKPTYEATENILIGKLANENSNYGDSQELSMLLASTIDFITSPIVLNTVRKELNINDDELEKKIVVQNNKNSQIVNVVVRENNMEDAKKLVNTIATISVNKMKEEFGVQDIKLLSEINGEPSVKRVGSLTLNLAIGIFVGFLLGVGLSMMKEHWDDSIKDVKEIEDFIGLPVLGEISIKNKNRKYQNKSGSTQQEKVLNRSKGGQISV